MMNYKKNHETFQNMILSGIFAGFSLNFVPVAAAATAPNLADIHSYRLLNFPTGDAPCEGMAAELAANLKASAGVEIYSTSCETVEKGVSNLEINYIGAQALTITSTQAKRLMDTPNGMYQTLEDCQAGLGAEVSAFEENLGLKSFVSYCFSTVDSSHFPFVARVDAIGAAQNGMRVIDDLEIFFSPVLGDTAILSDVMTERLRERGVKVVRSVVGMEDGISEYWAGARYYAKGSSRIKLQEVTYYKSEGACHRDREALQSVLENGKVPPLSVFCTSDSLMGVARLYFMMLPGDYGSELAPDSFVSRDACLAGKAGVEEAYRTALKRDVIGSLCIATDREEGGFGVLVFSNN